MGNFSDFVTRLKQCSDLGAARELHAQILRSGRDDSSDTYLGNLLVETYARCGSIHEARAAFHRIQSKNLFSCGIFMAELQRAGERAEVIDTARRMDFEGLGLDPATLLAVACCCDDLELGRAIHARISDSGYGSLERLGNSLVTMYARCGSIKNSRAVFDAMHHKSVVSWTSMIAAYAKCGDRDAALGIFRDMVAMAKIQPNCITLVTVLEICSNSEEVIEIHSLVSSGSWSVPVANSLVAAYGHCGRLDLARAVFKGLEEFSKSVVSWTSMIAAYAQNGHPREAMELYCQMNLHGRAANAITFAIVASACSDLGILAAAQQLHARIVAEGFARDPVLVNAMVEMFAKCGDLIQARDIFNAMQGRSSAVAWNTIIAANARGGHGDVALELLREMALEGVPASRATFSSVFLACSHAGFLHRGLALFVSMAGDHGITADNDHVASMVDLLARAGLLGESSDLVASEERSFHHVGWRSLVAASCRA